MLSLIQKYPFILAFILGTIPALFWLWFWLKEDRHPEPHKMVTLSFLGGMAAVILVLPVQHLMLDYIGDSDSTLFTVLCAAVEELFKFGFVYFIALNRATNDEPVDNIIYLIISALGFVAMENTLYLIDPIHVGNFFETIVSGNLRFVGASLLHIMASATIGIHMGLSMYKSRLTRYMYLFHGIMFAIILHSIFNLLIIRKPDTNIFLIFGSVWIGIIALLLLFEKVKHIIPNKLTYER